MSSSNSLSPGRGGYAYLPRYTYPNPVPQPRSPEAIAHRRYASPLRFNERTDLNVEVLAKEQTQAPDLSEVIRTLNRQLESQTLALEELRSQLQASEGVRTEYIISQERIKELELQRIISQERIKELELQLIEFQSKSLRLEDLEKAHGACEAHIKVSDTRIAELERQLAEANQGPPSAADLERDRRRAEIMKIYRLFDTNHDSDVVMDEFFSLASIFEKKKMTPELAKKMFAKLDSDGSGGIDADEFVKFVAGKMIKMSDDKFDQMIVKMIGMATAERGQQAEAAQKAAEEEMARLSTQQAKEAEGDSLLHATIKELTEELERLRAASSISFVQDDNPSITT